ncbi:hypothetical protein [Flindersiella endophytica]
MPDKQQRILAADPGPDGDARLAAEGSEETGAAAIRGRLAEIGQDA